MDLACQWIRSANGARPCKLPAFWEPVVRVKREFSSVAANRLENIREGSRRKLPDPAREAHITVRRIVADPDIHRRKALADVFGTEMATEVWDRFTVHYTPTHGSWLNQAEIEIGIFSRQCLGNRRIPDLKTLRQEARAWNRRRSPGSSTVRLLAGSLATNQNLLRGQRTSCHNACTPVRVRSNSSRNTLRCYLARSLAFEGASGTSCCSSSAAGHT